MSQIEATENFLRKLFNVRKDESLLVLNLSIHHFFMGFGMALLLIVANAVFLSAYPIYKLPLIYVISGVVLVVSGRIYSFLEHRLRIEKLFPLVLILVIGLALAGWAGVSLWEEALMGISLMVIYRVIYLLGNLEFWGLSALLFDVRQSKRLFGLISSGDVPAKLLGYLSVSLLAPTIGLGNILLIAAACFTVSLLTLYILLTGKEMNLDDQTHSHPPAHSSASKIFGSKLTVWLAVLSGLGIIALTVIDFSFLTEVKKRYHTEVEMAAFLGVFFAFGKGITIVLKLFFSGRLIDRLGVKRSLLITPLIILILSVFPLLAQFEIYSLTTAFWLFGVIMLISEILQYGINGPVFLALFQPLDQHKRLQGHTMVKGLTDALALLAAGALLIIITDRDTEAGEHLQSINFLLLFVVATWLFSVFPVSREFLSSLREAVSKRFLRGAQLQINGEDSLRIIKEKLNSEYSGEVVYAMDLLKENNSIETGKLILEKTLTDSSEVSKRAIKICAELNIPGLKENLSTILKEDFSEDLKTLAIRIFAAYGREGAEQVMEYLHHGKLTYREAAVHGLIASGQPEYIRQGKESLRRMFRSSEKSQNEAAVKILTELKPDDFYESLIDYLDHTDREIRRKAILACKQIGHESLYDKLIQLLQNQREEITIIHVVPEFGEESLLKLTKLLQDGSLSVSFRKNLCKEIIRNKSESAKGIFLRLLRDDNVYVRRSAFQAAAAHNVRLNDQNFWRKSLNDEIWFAEEINAEISREEENICLRNALLQELEWVKQSLFDHLELLFDRPQIRESRRALILGGKERTANALEILDTLLPREISQPIISIFCSVLPEPGLLNSVPVKRYPLSSFGRRILEERNRQFSNWTVQVAMLSKDQSAVNSGTVAEQPTSDEQSLAQTRLKETKMNEDDFLSGVEKVIILKSTALFSETPEDTLVDVAAIMISERFVEGDEIFSKDDLGNAMYIIYEGKVRIHDGDDEFGILGQRDFFGELALLDPAPRSASATCVEDSMILKLEEGPFYELMDERIEVGRGILKELCERIRKDNRQISQLKSRLDQS